MHKIYEGIISPSFATIQKSTRKADAEYLTTKTADSERIAAQMRWIGCLHLTVNTTLIAFIASHRVLNDTYLLLQSLPLDIIYHQHITMRMPKFRGGKTI